MKTCGPILEMEVLAESDLEKEEWNWRNQPT